MAKKTAQEQQDLASSYGWALSMLRSNPELSKLFDNAIAGSWNSSRFVAGLRDTKWYKTRGEAQRQNEVLRKVDPGEYKRRGEQTRAQVEDAYFQMFGRKPSAHQLAVMTNSAFAFGFSENEIRDLVGQSGATAKQMQAGLGGTLGEAERQIRGAIEDYGLDMGESWIARQLNYVATGRADATSIANYLKQGAISKYGAYKDELENGMTIRDIAEPYRQLMSKVLELPDKGLSLSDPTIQKALQFRAPAKGKTPGGPAQMPLWQFESQLKNDQRWNGTQNAQDSIMAAGRKVLADWGLTAGSNG